MVHSFEAIRLIEVKILNIILEATILDSLLVLIVVFLYLDVILAKKTFSLLHFIRWL